MITELTIKNLKSFGNSVQLAFSRVNLLTGMNGRGKSTVLQTLLILAQSYDKDKGISKISLGGSSVNLGSFEDVIHRGSKSQVISIDIHTDDEEDNEIHFDLSRDNGNDRQLSIDELIVNDKSKMETVVSQQFVTSSDGKMVTTEDGIPVVAEVEERRLGSTSDVIGLRQLRNIIFISADREGGKNIKSIEDGWTINDGVGVHGQYVMEMLEYATKEQRIQVNYWLNQVLDGGAVMTKEDKGRNEISMYIDPAGTDKGFKPSNVGFGYSYILSILVAIVMAEKGAKLFVENPEAHLHPSAQAKLISAIVEMTKEKDMQVFIESHSDHVLHGLQLAVNREMISNEDLTVLFFSFEENEPNLTLVNHLFVTEDGHIEKPPYGFFDQAEQDLSSLIGLDDIDAIFEEE